MLTIYNIVFVCLLLAALGCPALPASLGLVGNAKSIGIYMGVQAAADTILQHT
jgi:hypothetical protein